MKTVLLLILLFLFSSLQMKAQNQDSLIQLYKGMDDTIDFIDREMFDLFPDIEGFKYAQLFIRNNQSLVSKITCLENGIEKRLSLMENISKLSKINSKLYKLEEENINKSENPPEASLSIRNENILNGKLKMFSKKYLFLDSKVDNSNYESQLSYYKVPLTQVNYLHLTQENGFEKNLKYIGYGALGGGALGFLIGYAADDNGQLSGWEMLDDFERAAVAGLIGIGVGALVGLIIGEIAEPFYSEFTITFNSPNDILKLKEYSAYYYQQDKTLEEQYIEVK